MQRLRMRHNPADDTIRELPRGHRLRHHVRYRIELAGTRHQGQQRSFAPNGA
jgi:hypothetical protein